MALLLTVIVLAFGYAGYRIWDRWQHGNEVDRLLAGTAAVTPRRSVAVLGFKDLSGRPATAWLSPALAEMLSTEQAWVGGRSSP